MADVIIHRQGVAGRITLNRPQALRDALPAADRERLRFLPVRDRYDEPAWVQDVRLGVARMLPTPSEQRVVLVGHFKDASSNYLRRFPGWTLLDLPRQGSMDATAIRDAYWAATPGTVSAALAPLAQDMPPSTLRFLHDFATLPAYAALQEEWRVLRDYRASWAQAPYPPVFVTVDAVLRCQNHVLLVRRGQAPGKGLWAAPGGFLEPRDTLWQSCLRELSEETACPLDEATLRAALRAVKVFDHPDRSQRGRTITHAHYFDLGNAPMPAVRADDDALQAEWIPVGQIAALEAEFFEDHFHMLDHFLQITGLVGSAG